MSSAGPRDLSQHGRTPPVLVGLGEVLCSGAGQAARPGGSPARFAVSAAHLGCRAVLLSRTGADAAGSVLRRKLAAAGVETRHLQEDAERPTEFPETGRELHDRMQAEMPWDHLEWTEDWRAVLAGAHAVCFSTLAMRRPRSRATLTHALDAAAGARRVCLLRLRHSFYTPERMRWALGRSHVVHLELQDARVLGALLEVAPRSGPELARELVAEFGIEVLCLRSGATRSIVTPEGGLELPAEGDAGDEAFTAALVVAQLRGAPLSRAGEFARQVAELAARHPADEQRLRQEYAALQRRSFAQAASG